MELTRAGDYGIYGVIHLAKQPKGKIVSLAEVSRAENIPEKFLAKIFQNLTRSSLIISHRGARGGFSLARSPDQITVKELLESVQGPIHFTKCLSELGDCDRKEICELRKLLKKAQDFSLELLSKHTLADLAK